MRATSKRNRICECSDVGCPVHHGQAVCLSKAKTTVYRVDMEDHTGTRMCEACAGDAMDSGLFTTREN